MPDKIIPAPFVKMVPTTEIPITQDPLTGHFATYNSDGKFAFTPIESFRKIISTGNVGEATPTSSPTPWTTGDPDLFEKWDVVTPGTYINFIDASDNPIEVSAIPDLKDNLVQIWVTNGISKKVLSEKRVPSNKINTWVAGVYQIGDQVISLEDYSIYEANASITSSDIPGVSSKWIKKVAGVIDIIESPFSHKLNFQKDYWFRYSKLFGAVSIKEDAGSVFGKMNFLKLTGGDVIFGSNFLAQSGSASYIPTKTNVITTWSEYGKVRYFIENFDFEPIVFNSKTKTFYDFTNKGANTQLSSITVDYGLPFTGKVSYWKINSAGTMLTSTTAASSLQTDAISIDKGDLTDYKVTLFMAFGAHFVISPNDNTGGTFTDHIRFMKGTPNTTVRHSSPSGNVDTTTTLVPAVATTGYLWEIEVRGNAIKVYINSGLAYEGVTTQTGDFFSMAFTGVGDMINSIILEEL